MISSLASVLGRPPFTKLLLALAFSCHLFYSYARTPHAYWPGLLGPVSSRACELLLEDVTDLVGSKIDGLVSERKAGNGSARSREHRGSGSYGGSLPVLVQFRELPELHAERRRGSHDRPGYQPLAGEGALRQERLVRRQDHRDGPEPRNWLEHDRRRGHDVRRGALRGGRPRTYAG